MDAPSITVESCELHGTARSKRWGFELPAEVRATILQEAELNGLSKDAGPRARLNRACELYPEMAYGDQRLWREYFGSAIRGDQGGELMIPDEAIRILRQAGQEECFDAFEFWCYQDRMEAMLVACVETSDRQHFFAICRWYPTADVPVTIERLREDEAERKRKREADEKAEATAKEGCWRQGRRRIAWTATGCLAVILLCVTGVFAFIGWWAILVAIASLGCLFGTWDVWVVDPTKPRRPIAWALAGAILAACALCGVYLHFHDRKVTINACEVNPDHNKIRSADGTVYYVDDGTDEWGNPDRGDLVYVDSSREEDSLEGKRLAATVHGLPLRRTVTYARVIGVARGCPR